MLRTRLRCFDQRLATRTKAFPSIPSLPQGPRKVRKASKALKDESRPRRKAFGRMLVPFRRRGADSGDHKHIRANGFKTPWKCARTCWKPRMVPQSVEWVPIRANAPSIQPNSSPRLRNFFSLPTKLRGLLGLFTPFVS